MKTKAHTEPRYFVLKRMVRGRSQKLETMKKTQQARKTNQKNDQKQIKQIIRHVMLILGWLLSCFVHFVPFCV
jgi:preprotein translocase subunit Sec63